MMSDWLLILVLIQLSCPTDSMASTSISKGEAISLPSYQCLWILKFWWVWGLKADFLEVQSSAMHQMGRKIITLEQQWSSANVICGSLMRHRFRLRKIFCSETFVSFLNILWWKVVESSSMYKNAVREVQYDLNRNVLMNVVISYTFFNIWITFKCRSYE